MLQNNFNTWIEISSKAIKHNLDQLKKIIKPSTQIMPIIKANAYGHGFIEIAKILVKLKVKWVGVASLEEALELRENNIKTRILVLSFYNQKLLNQAVQKNITLTIYSYEVAEKINSISKKLKKVTPIHFKIDTGTSRLGLLANDSVESILRITKLSNIKIEGLFSHLADAENPNQKFTKKQTSIFNKVVKELEINKVKINYKHLACSAAVFLNKDTHKDIVRYGISLYGMWSIKEDNKIVKDIYKKVTLKPVLSWYTKIIQIKKLEAGSSVGYGQSYKTIKKTRIALIPVGYYDGYDRKLSNIGEVLIKGKRCKVIGKVCMNLTIIDVTKINSLKTGDIVTLIGKNRGQFITANELADKVGTINYEILTRINKIIPRLTTK